MHFKFTYNETYTTIESYAREAASYAYIISILFDIKTKPHGVILILLLVTSTISTTHCLPSPAG